MGVYADRAETSRLPAGGAANCATVGTIVSTWEVQREYVQRRSRQDLASPCGGSCQMRNCRHFRELLGPPPPQGVCVSTTSAGPPRELSEVPTVAQLATPPAGGREAGIREAGGRREEAGGGGKEEEEEEASRSSALFKTSIQHQADPP